MLLPKRLLGGFEGAGATHVLAQNVVRQYFHLVWILVRRRSGGRAELLGIWLLDSAASSELSNVQNRILGRFAFTCSYFKQAAPNLFFS
jgi:hypothetical protein